MIVDVVWDFDDDDIICAALAMNLRDYCHYFFVSGEKYMGMSYNEKSERAEKYAKEWRLSGHKSAYEILGLPLSVDIPEDIGEEDIADWLSDEYGYCVSSYCS